MLSIAKADSLVPTVYTTRPGQVSEGIIHSVLSSHAILEMRALTNLLV